MLSRKAGGFPVILLTLTLVGWLLAVPVMALTKQCRSPRLQADFDLSRYLGTWHEIYRTKSIRFEKGSDITANYTKDPQNPERVIVRNTQKLEGGKVDSIEGVAYVRDPKNAPAQLSVSFFWPIKGDYRIVETDYENYAVVYSCQTWLFGLFKSEAAWILARKTTLEDSTVDRLFTLIKEQTGLEREEFLKSPKTEA